MLNLLDFLNPITNTLLNTLIQNTYIVFIYFSKSFFLTGFLSTLHLFNNLFVYINSVTSIYFNLKLNNRMLALWSHKVRCTIKRQGIELPIELWREWRFKMEICNRILSLDNLQRNPFYCKFDCDKTSGPKNYIPSQTCNEIVYWNTCGKLATYSMMEFFMTNLPRIFPRQTPWKISHGFCNRIAWKICYRFRKWTIYHKFLVFYTYNSNHMLCSTWLNYGFL